MVIENSMSISEEQVGVVLSNERDGERQYLLAPSSDKPKPKGSAWYSGSAVMANSALGIGLLNLPRAFDRGGGIYVATVVQLLLLVLLVTSVILLMYITKLTNIDTYSTLVKSLCGRAVGALCTVVVCLIYYGAMVTAFCIIGDQWSKFFLDTYGDDYCQYWYMSRPFLITTSSVLLVLPFCFFKRIDSLRHVSVVGAISIGYISVMIIAKYFTEPRPVPVHVKVAPDSWTEVVFLVPVLFFCYELHVEIVPVFSCLEKKTTMEGLKTIFGAVVVCLAVYTSTAIFGNLTIGTGVRDDILLSYQSDWSLVIGQLLIAVKCLMSFPVFMFLCRSTIDDFWVRLRGLTAEGADLTERRRRIVISSVLFITSLLLALVVPGIDVAVQFIGVLVTFLMFVFPGLCMVQLPTWQREKATHPRLFRVAGVLFVVFGVFILGVTITQNIMSFAAPADQDPVSASNQYDTRGPCL